jgi:hypothetical protein
MKTNLLRGIALLVVAVLLFSAGTPRPAAAQSYSFYVRDLKLQVYALPDGTARLVYDITFQNTLGSHPIDIVDIGMPHADYDIGNMLASVDGQPINEITPSDLVKPGVSIYLGDRSITGDHTGTVHFEATLPKLIYQDVTHQGYASLRISPTWFDPDIVNGTTNVQIAIHMLPGIQPDELLYQLVPFTQKALYQDHAVAVWQWPSGHATQAYLVGVSFPQRGITGGVVPQTVLDLAVQWLEDNPGIRTILGLVMIGLFAFVFFRFSGGTGVSVFVVLAAVIGYLIYASAAAQLFFVPVLVALVIVNEVQLSRRRSAYLPAIAQVEGGGIKRGLTAPEAAALLEMPLNKVLTLIIFGLLKKGVLVQRQGTPLTVDVAGPFQATAATQKARLQAAQDKGIVLHDYENDFLDEIQLQPGRALQELNFSIPMKKFLQGVAGRIKGFDLSDTQDYYRSIIQRALAEAKGLGDVTMREEQLDRNFEWILLSRDYRTVFDSPTYHYTPIWTRTTTPSSRVGGLASAAQAAAPARGGSTSFGDVAAGFAGWTETTMGSLASAISPGSLQVPTSQGGFVNLSGADKATGDIFKALAESSSSGSSGRSGGGGGHCACACAGCACACACAGGGR